VKLSPPSRIFIMMPAEPNQASPDRPIPLPIALGVMAAILVGGGALIWRFVYRPALAQNAIRTVAPTADNPRVAGGPSGVLAAAGDAGIKINPVQAAAEADLPSGIHTRPGGDVLIKSGDAYVRLIPAAGDEPARQAFGYFTLPETEWEHGYLTQGVRRLLTQEDFAKELALTDDQRARLEKLPAAPSIRWTDAERDRLLALYNDAKTRGEVVAALAAYAATKRAADQKVMTQRVKEIRAILSEKQLARINPIPRWPLTATPASAPSTPDRAPRDP
jgi:hypothetical protein